MGWLAGSALELERVETCFVQQQQIWNSGYYAERFENRSLNRSAEAAIRCMPKEYPWRFAHHQMRHDRLVNGLFARMVAKFARVFRYHHAASPGGRLKD